MPTLAVRRPRSAVASEAIELTRNVGYVGLHSCLASSLAPSLVPCVILSTGARSAEAESRRISPARFCLYAYFGRQATTGGDPSLRSG
jgi:hypothetical protein